jgi:hypothetical protein
MDRVGNKGRIIGVGAHICALLIVGADIICPIAPTGRDHAVDFRLRFNR